MPLTDFLTSYRGREAQMQAQPTQQLGQMGALQGILSKARAEQEMQQLRGVLTGDPAKDMPILLKIGTPTSITLAEKMYHLMPKPAEPYTVPEGSVRFNAQNEPVAFGAPKDRTQNQSNLSRLMAEKAALPPGDPRHTFYDNALRKESETAKQISPTVVMPRAEQPPVAIMGPDGKPVFVSREDAIGKPPAVKETADRVVPAPIVKAYTENSTALRKIDRALEEVTNYPQAFGLQNMRGDAISQRVDPKGTTARALIADIGSLKIHDRSGAAVTAAETPRLLPFIPNVNDNAATIKKKLTLFKNEYAAIQNDIGSMYNSEQGYKPLPGPKTRESDMPTVDSLLEKYK